MKLDFTYIFSSLENIKKPCKTLYESEVLNFLWGEVHKSL